MFKHDIPRLASDDSPDSSLGWLLGWCLTNSPHCDQETIVTRTLIAAGEYIQLLMPHSPRDQQ